MNDMIMRIGDGTGPGREAEEGGAGESGLPPDELQLEAREYIWLDEVRNGVSTTAIALREGVARRSVQWGVRRAQDREVASYQRESRIRDMLQKLDQAGAGAPRGYAGRWAGRFPPKLVPFFPIGPLTPGSACPHRGPIRHGSRLCCMVCSKSGVDDHPALKRNPKTDPRPEPKVVPQQAKASPRPETRKERRRRLFAAIQDGPRPAVAV
jgi:hypothetical protein